MVFALNDTKSSFPLMCELVGWACFVYSIVMSIIMSSIVVWECSLCFSEQVVGFEGPVKSGSEYFNGPVFFASV